MFYKSKFKAVKSDLTDLQIRYDDLLQDFRNYMQECEDIIFNFPPKVHDLNFTAKNDDAATVIDRIPVLLRINTLIATKPQLPQPATCADEFFGPVPALLRKKRDQKLDEITDSMTASMLAKPVRKKRVKKMIDPTSTGQNVESVSTPKAKRGRKPKTRID